MVTFVFVLFYLCITRPTYHLKLLWFVTSTHNAYVKHHTAKINSEACLHQHDLSILSHVILFNAALTGIYARFLEGPRMVWKTWWHLAMFALSSLSNVYIGWEALVFSKGMEKVHLCARVCFMILDVVIFRGNYLGDIHITFTIC